MTHQLMPCPIRALGQRREATRPSAIPGRAPRRDALPCRPMRSCLALLALVVLSLPATDAEAEVHRFTPTAGVPTFAVRDPVLRIKPGDVVESHTFSRPGDYYERAGGPWPGEVGPFFIDGADDRRHAGGEDRPGAPQP